LGRSTQVEMLKVYGDTSRLIPSHQLIGQQLWGEDTKGCLISGPVADQLWGNQDVIGKMITYKDQEYSIRGIVEEKSNIIILQTPKGDDTTGYSGLRVAFNDPQNMKENIRQFETKYSLGQQIVIDFSQDVVLWTQLVLVPGWLIAGVIIFKLFRRTYNNRHKWKHTLMWSIIGAISIVILIKIVKFKIGIPLYLIPNQWSDFEFWIRTWEELRQGQVAIQALPTLLPDLWRLESIQMVQGGICTSVMMFYIAAKYLVVESFESLFWNILMAIVISFTAIMVTNSIGIVIGPIAAIWIIWPCYIMSKQQL
ncbi:MAG: hypothetical protein ACRCTE_06000, partial [Cellulosilyticaceae bacterium]